LHREEKETRRVILQAAISHLENSRSEASSEDAEICDDLAQHYRHRLATLVDEGDSSRDGIDPTFHKRFNDLSRELLRVERQAAVQLRNERRINDELLRKIEHELDLGEARLMAKSSEGNFE
jgi:monovalent cation/hydrogen antiporter